MRILKLGSIGTEVGTLQTNFNKAGISKQAIGADLVVDDQFGLNTLAVLHFFQNKQGLVDDGIYGPNSDTALQVLLAGGGVVTLPAGITYGIDLYHGDSISDLQKFLNSNFKFVVHKATEGNNHVDVAWASRRKVLEDGGKLVTAYMYIHPNESAKSQTDLILKTVGKQTPIAIDWEEEDGVPNVMMNDVVQQIIDNLRSAQGIEPIVYGSWGQLSGYGVRASIAKQKLWDADIRQGQSAPRIPSPWMDWFLWQYSFTANVPGIGNGCDVNKFRGTIEDLKKILYSPIQ